MDGEIKTYLPEKKYGFIKGNDGKDYYFHANEFKNKNDLPNLCEEAFVTFDQKATPKGYKAVKCSLVDSSDIITYTAPNTLLTSKTNSIKGWQTLEYGEWAVCASSRSSPDDAKDIMISYAEHIGANALIDVRYSKTTGSESSDSGKGTYHYSIHNYRGRIATVAKKNANGKYTKEQLLGVNQRAENIKKEMTEKVTRYRKNLWILTLIISAIVVFSDTPEVSLVIIGASIFITFYFLKYDEWLDRI